MVAKKNRRKIGTMTYHPTKWGRIQKARLNVESDNLVPRFLYIKSFRKKF